MARILDDWVRQDRKAQKALKSSERKPKKKARSKGSSAVGKREGDIIEETRWAGLKAAGVVESRLDAAQAQRISDLQHAAARVDVFLVARCSQADQFDVLSGKCLSGGTGQDVRKRNPPCCFISFSL